MSALYVQIIDGLNFDDIAKKKYQADPHALRKRSNYQLENVLMSRCKQPEIVATKAGSSADIPTETYNVAQSVFLGSLCGCCTTPRSSS